jgi:hypothetical protein
MPLPHGTFSTYLRITPLLFLCGHLSLGLSQTSKYIILHLFCGQRESRTGLLRGPRGLIHSLIMQLFSAACAFNHDFIHTRASLLGINYHTLCKIFARRSWYEISRLITSQTNGSSALWRGSCGLKTTTSFKAWKAYCNILD